MLSHGDLFSTPGVIDVESIFSNGGGGSGSYYEKLVMFVKILCT